MQVSSPSTIEMQTKDPHSIQAFTRGWCVLCSLAQVDFINYISNNNNLISKKHNKTSDASFLQFGELDFSKQEGNMMRVGKVGENGMGTFLRIKTKLAVDRPTL